MGVNQNQGWKQELQILDKLFRQMQAINPPAARWHPLPDPRATVDAATLATPQLTRLRKLGGDLGRWTPVLRGVGRQVYTTGQRRSGVSAQPATVGLPRK